MQDGLKNLQQTYSNLPWEEAVHNADSIFLFQYCSVLKKNYQPFNIGTLESVFTKISKLNFEPNQYLLQRTLFFLNKYYHISNIHQALLKNYLSLQFLYYDLKPLDGSWKNCWVLLRNESGYYEKVINSGEALGRLQDAFAGISDLLFPELEEIIANCPYWLKELSALKKDKQKKTWLRKKLSGEVIHYLDQLPLSKNKKYLFLASCFVQLALLPNELAFRNDFTNSDTIDSYTSDLYTTYLRNVGKNYWRLGR